MRNRLFLIAAVLAGAASAQIPPAPQPDPPMVPAVRPPLGAASRAMRHELLADERSQRLAEKAEDRADAQQQREEARRKLRRIER